MSFGRQPADEWQKAVPGARWFKADLHIHTVDDHAGGRTKLPEGLSGDPADPEVALDLGRFHEDAAARFAQTLHLRVEVVDLVDGVQ